MVFRKKKAHNLLNFKRRTPAAGRGAAAAAGVHQEQEHQPSVIETSIHRKNKGEAECDFYQNPTILSRLILHQKYPAAIRRLKKVPTEASIWVTSTRCSGDDTGRPAAGTIPANGSGNKSNSNRHINASDQFNRATSASTMISALTDSLDSEATPKDIVWNGPATECTPDEKVSRNSSSLSSSSSQDQSQPHPKNNNNNKTYSFRQLPLHMACSNLRLLLTDQTSSFSSWKQQLEQLISQLIVTFPQACARRDHEYRLPLHEALWNNASPDAIVLLLIAYPEAVNEPDIYGRTAAELNEYRRGASPAEKKAVARMLQRNADFWKFAKQEAELRLKHSNVPDVNASVNSTSVLNDSLAADGDITLATRESAFQGRAVAGNEPAPTRTPTETSWSQLEKRVLNLERALAESYEQNYGMAQEISRLEDIQKKYYKVTAKQFLAKQVIQLEEDNAELRMQLSLMETILKRNNLSVEDASVFSGPTSVEVEDDTDHPAVAQMQNQQQHQQRQQDEVEQLRDDNLILRAQVASLTSRMEEFQRMLEDYEQDAQQRQEEKRDETQKSTTTEEDKDEEEQSFAMSLSTTTVHSQSSNMIVEEQALVPIPPTVSPLQRGTTNNLDGLLELAENMYGHKFSPELVEAWRNITVDGDNFSLFSGVGGMSVLDRLSEVDIEDEIDEELSLPLPSEVKSNEVQNQSSIEACEEKGDLSQRSPSELNSSEDRKQSSQKDREENEDMSLYSVLWA